MKTLTILLVLVSSFVSASDFPGEISGEVTLEHRYYPNNGEYGNEDRHHSAVVIEADYSRSWNNDRYVLSVVPFARFDQTDTNRSHFDVRELSFVSSWNFLELRIGVSTVFWGVTESQHLVDVVNQTDFVENPDGEQKLGQPMINPSFVTPVGNFELFLLPYFRERTLPGEQGRFRGAIHVDTDNPEYSNDDKNRHIDYALRWSANWQDLEWALSAFTGTDRDPYFRYDATTNRLIPVYGQSRQLGLELQYIYKDLLAKVELLRKDSSFYDLYTAATAGFEYTFANISDGLDIGLLYEWLYDSRATLSPTGMYDASFFGSRLAFNDTASTQMLVGAIFDNENVDMNLYRLEASRRIGQSTTLGMEVFIIRKPKKDSMLYQFRSDDYFQITISRYF